MAARQPDGCCSGSGHALGHETQGRTVSLGRGHRAPYPEPTTKAAASVGRGNRRTGTRPEAALRSHLHRRGLRFRKDLLLRLGQVRVRPDVVFPRAKVAVFLDGCFWHCCPQHGRIPGANRGYWEPKLARNVARDREANEALHAAGWTVLRVWEHDDPALAAGCVAEAVFHTRDRVRRTSGRIQGGRMAPGEQNSNVGSTQQVLSVHDAIAMAGLDRGHK